MSNNSESNLRSPQQAVNNCGMHMLQNCETMWHTHGAVDLSNLLGNSALSANRTTNPGTMMVRSQHAVASRAHVIPHVGTHASR